MQEGLLGQSARQRGEEEGGQDHRKEGRSMQEAATGELKKLQMVVLPVLPFKLFSAGSQGGSPGVHKGQRAPGKVKD